MIKENAALVLKNIADALKSSGRSEDEVTLIAVSKTFGADKVAEARLAGIKNFGENKVQEAKRKIELIDADVKWHLIGRLQTNKAKTAVRLFDVIHSVGSVRLAKILDDCAAKLCKNIDILLQVNIAGDERKNGVAPEDAAKAVLEIIRLKNVRLKGLMTIPPFFSEEEKVRPYYKELRRLKDAINDKLGTAAIKELSMGMSNDYKTAIQEGATYVRVGTAIFGGRDYAVKK